jgi:hypothetical protein
VGSNETLLTGPGPGLCTSCYHVSGVYPVSLNLS